MERTEALTSLLADPSSTALLVDFDGTLAPIVEDPAAARPLPGATDALRALAARFAVVAVVSGRPLAFLQGVVPEEVTVSGLYGIEWRRDGTRGEHAEAAAWRPVVAAAVERARAELPAGVEIEPKGASVTLHVRRHPELGDVASAWAESVAGSTGLVARPAKRSVELHPPLAVDKGTVVEELVGSLGAACFIGDDVGDLAAFDALDRLSRRGCRTLRVVAASSEVDPEVQRRADVVLPGPAGVLELLSDLAGGAAA